LEIAHAIHPPKTIHQRNRSFGSTIGSTPQEQRNNFETVEVGARF
jgi:hypothetical protein